MFYVIKKSKEVDRILDTYDLSKLNHDWDKPNSWNLILDRSVMQPSGWCCVWNAFAHSGMSIPPWCSAVCLYFCNSSTGHLKMGTAGAAHTANSLCWSKCLLLLCPERSLVGPGRGWQGPLADVSNFWLLEEGKQDWVGRKNTLSVLLIFGGWGCLQALYLLQPVWSMHPGEPDAGTRGTLSGWTKACSLVQWRLEATSASLLWVGTWPFCPWILEPDLVLGFLVVLNTCFQKVNE